MLGMSASERHERFRPTVAKALRMLSAHISTVARDRGALLAAGPLRREKAIPMMGSWWLWACSRLAVTPVRDRSW